MEGRAKLDLTRRVISITAQVAVARRSASAAWSSRRRAEVEAADTDLIRTVALAAEQRALPVAETVVVAGRKSPEVLGARQCVPTVQRVLNTSVGEAMTTAVAVAAAITAAAVPVTMAVVEEAQATSQVRVSPAQQRSLGLEGHLA